MLIVTTHAYQVNGKIHEFPTSTITEILKKEAKDFIFIRHSIDGKLPSILYHYEGKQIISKFEKKLVSFKKHLAVIINMNKKII